MACTKWPLRRYFRLLWWTLCLLTFLALPLTIWEFQKQHYDVHYQAWFIGGIFVILSMPISIYEIAMHTEYYTQPRLQKHVIRILLMVPIYAVDAWFALRFRRAREYLDPIRECYEAFVIYSFFAYLMAYLQDQYGDLDEHLSKKPQMQHFWGVRWILRPWDMGTRFLWECKKGVLNYVILRPICTGLAFITDIFDKYGEGQINFDKSYVYLAAVTNFSQLWALYCLVMLYTAMHEELAPIRPLSKFLCIKAVVFVTFWQGIAIAILVYAGVIRKESWTTYDKLNVASGIQDFLICIEMFLAALAHAYAFPPRDYMAGHSKGFFSNVRYIFDLRDVVDDVGLVVEEHVSSATTAVVKVPQRAVKKAAQGLAKNTKKLFGAGSRGSSGRLVDDEEEAASKCALLGPASPSPPPGTSTDLSGRGAGAGGPGRGERGGSSAGGSVEALASSYGGTERQARQPLIPPQQHLMMGDLEGLGQGLASAAPAPSGVEPPSPRIRGGGFNLPPLPPSSAVLGVGGGTAAAAASAAGSAFNNLVSSALYNTRAGYGEYGGGGGASRGTRRGSGSDEYQMPGDASPYAEFSLESNDPAVALAAAGPSGGGTGGEVPLVGLHHQGRSAVGTEGTGRRLSGSEGSGGSANSGGSGGAGNGGSGRYKGKGEVSARGSRVAGLLSGAGGGGGGVSSGEDPPYEKLPTPPTAPKRAHDE